MNSVNELEPGQDQSPLGKAINNEDGERVIKLIEEGVDVNGRDHRGLTPLGLAVCKKSIPIMKLLVEAGADPEGLDSHGQPPLFLAASGPDTETGELEFLIGAGASVNVPVEQGEMRMPLHQAVIENLVDKVRVLLGAGADVNAEDRDGRNAIFYACMVDGDMNEEIVRMLLEKGADPFWQNINGTTPIHYAASVGKSHYPCIELMEMEGRELRPE